ncbi:LOW QUALITY PROTEIN: hypothetical protein PHPALM_31966 [Phytophthora palmivora]|uniref:Uncharacterized protein n=1 Tax=Phytophthora palmivora TaxID=4796 RepID=A0A2P4X191_9STRA|nr:LOW QUALITY PROTEIN: hypothetical protein PHPALM_31966 [Phytophthora palmivora]
MWNLMIRADSVDTNMLQHIEWSDDWVIVEEQGHKDDQTGAEEFGKHVYANPHHNAQFLFSLHTFANAPNAPLVLFLGRDSKDRFGRILWRGISALSDEEMRSLNYIREDIGTHSLRKGSSSYALGQVNGPIPVSVHLRMGLSLGKLKVLLQSITSSTCGIHCVQKDQREILQQIRCLTSSVVPLY